MSLASVYSSSAACDVKANRALREVRTKAIQTGTFVQDALYPLAMELRDHHKLKRGAVVASARKMAETLREHDVVLNVNYHPLTNKLSPREAALVNTIFTESHGGCAEFVIAEFLLTRKSITLSVTSSHLQIHEHVLSRFMHREREAAEEFFKDVMLSVKVASFLGAVSDHNSPHIALPFRDGLLLGRRHFLNGPPEVRRLVLDPKKGIRDTYIDSRISLTGDLRTPVCKMITYIDGQSMGPKKKRLRDAIVAYVTEHSAAIDHIFEAVSYDMAMVPDDEVAAAEMARDAIKAAKVLVAGPEWQEYLSTAAAEAKASAA